MAARMQAWGQNAGPEDSTDQSRASKFLAEASFLFGLDFLEGSVLTVCIYILVPFCIWQCATLFFFF